MKRKAIHRLTRTKLPRQIYLHDWIETECGCVFEAQESKRQRSGWAFVWVEKCAVHAKTA